jgi:hypothetical protein
MRAGEPGSGCSAAIWTSRAVVWPLRRPKNSSASVGQARCHRAPCTMVQLAASSLWSHHSSALCRLVRADGTHVLSIERYTPLFAARMGIRAAPRSQGMSAATRVETLASPLQQHRGRRRNKQPLTTSAPPPRPESRAASHHVVVRRPWHRWRGQWPRRANQQRALPLRRRTTAWETSTPSSRAAQFLHERQPACSVAVSRAAPMLRPPRENAALLAAAAAALSGVGVSSFVRSPTQRSLSASEPACDQQHHGWPEPIRGGRAQKRPAGESCTASVTDDSHQRSPTAAPTAGQLSIRIPPAAWVAWKKSLTGGPGVAAQGAGPLQRAHIDYPLWGPAHGDRLIGVSSRVRLRLNGAAHRRPAPCEEGGGVRRWCGITARAGRRRGWLPALPTHKTNRRPHQPPALSGRAGPWEWP